MVITFLNHKIPSSERVWVAEIWIWLSDGYRNMVGQAVFFFGGGVATFLRGEVIQRGTTTYTQRSKETLLLYKFLKKENVGVRLYKVFRIRTTKNIFYDFQ